MAAVLALIPSWDSLHVLIIHFPIGLLLIAPLFIALGIIQPVKGRLFSISALLLILIGTAFVYLAVETGEAAGELVDTSDNPQLETVLNHHAELADTTRLVFSGLTLAYAAILFAPALLKKKLAIRLQTALHVAFLLAYLGGCLLLANTAHNGGRLVHEFGVRAMIGGPSDAATTNTAILK